jgi:sensor histidine kinase YesM
MQFSVYNTTESARSTELKKHSGIGLENVKKRLQLLYPSQHQLLVKEKEGWFGIELNLSIRN